MRSTVFKGTTIISRAEAKAKGLPRFFTGKPCKYGHVSERYVSNHVCVRCNTVKQNVRIIESHAHKTTKAEPELDYAQIGKAIIERMKELEHDIRVALTSNHHAEQMKQDNMKLINKIKEQHDQIERLNKTIARLNEQLQRRPASTVGNDTFKMSEIARIK